MGHPLSLRLYLAAGARAELAERRALAQARESGAAGSGADRQGAAEAEALCRERLGEATVPRPEGPLLWIHSGRDRHALAARELARRLQYDRTELQVLVTTGAARRRGSAPEAAAQLAPIESLPAIRRFLDHWRPSLSLWTEPDLRPALAAETAARAIPQYLVDTRTAPPAPLPLRPWSQPAARLLAPFRKILTGDAETALGLRRLGARPDRIETPGFLEEGTAALPCNATERDTLAALFAGRPAWLAARTLDKELPAILDTHRAALRRMHRLLLILVPADPADGPAWKSRAQSLDFTVGLRSDGADPEHDQQIYIADTDDEMGLWYRLASVSFLGQSLTAGGGVNPFEAAALGSAILHGPNVRRYRRAYARLEQAGATRPVRNTEQLIAALEETLAPVTAATMAHAGWTICSAGAEVTDRAIALIQAELDGDPAG